MDRRFLTAASLAALYLLATPAHALNTEEVDPQTLKDYAVTLNAHAGNFQWQQLWKNTRSAGYFSEQSPTHFTTPMSQVPDLVSTTLSRATSVKPYASTRAAYRYDFATKVGSVNKVAVTALCVEVDWRTLPNGTAVDDAEKMKTVSLLLAKPCP
jgi:hypothetical protein